MGALLVNSAQNEAAGDEFKKAIDGRSELCRCPVSVRRCICTSKATADATGKIIAAPGTIEALQKYLELKPDGPFAGVREGTDRGTRRHREHHVHQSQRPGDKKKK